MNILHENKTVIGKLGVKSESRDALSMKLRLERLFGAGNFLPVGIPKKAIFCIKKLRDPAPQTLDLQSNALRFSTAWETAVSREIEKLYRRAARPFNEIIPAQTDSVIFSDKAELLACLASDWCAGNLFQNWWWRGLFPSLERAQTVAKIWIDEAESVPNALSILAEKGIAVKFVGKLQPGECSNLLEKLVQIFGLKKIHTSIFAPINKEEKESFHKAFDKSRKSGSGNNFFDEILKSNPTFNFLSESDFQKLTFEKKIFLVTSFILTHAPRFVRAVEFAEKIRQLKIETELMANDIYLKENFSEKTESKKYKKISGESFSVENKRKPRLDFNEFQIEKEKTKFETKPERGSEQSKEDFRMIENEIETKRATIIFESRASSEQQDKSEKISLKTGVERSQSFEQITQTKSEKENKNSETERIESRPIFTSETSEEAETETFEIVIRTNYGGIFFLLNLGLYLKLYRDFSEPLGEEFDLNIWDFVALLSVNFLGEEIKNDPVWSLLKRLAGIESDEEFSADFTVTNEWRVSRDWLKTFSKNEKWFWTKTENRLIVKRGENFNILDVSLSENFEEQLEKELKIYDEFYNELEYKNLESFYERFSSAESWLKNFYEFAETRLLQALNIETREELKDILFNRSATIAVSATHFEATFSLADLPLAVRFSGLDRDPGWIPAAGKYVEFYFV